MRNLRLAGRAWILLLAAISALGQTYNITSVAGGGLPDGLPAAAASLGWVGGVAVDSSGDVFLTLPNYSIIIERVAATGILRRIAGNGTPDFSGDNGPAINAQLSLAQYQGTPSGIALDSAGNLYIADSGNNRIRKVTNGVITTIAGGGSAGLGDNGLATNAQLFNPRGVALDSAGNLYIADTGDNLIRKVSNGLITTVAGGGSAGLGDNGPATSAQLNSPQGIAVDPTGNLYIADSFNGLIRRVSNGLITTVAGTTASGFNGDNIPATAAQLGEPTGVAVDSSGSFYIADTYNYRIRKVSNGVITTVAGNGTPGFSGDNGPAANAEFYFPSTVALDSSGNLYVADYYNQRIRYVSIGQITTIAGGGSSLGDNGPASSAQFYFPYGVAVGSAGSLFVADFDNHRVREVSNGKVTTVAGNGACCMIPGDNGPATGAEIYPFAVAMDSATNLYISDRDNIRKVSNDVITNAAGNYTYGFSGDNSLAINAQLYIPKGIAVDSAGNLYIADSVNNRIRKVSNGVITTVAGGGTVYPGDNGPATSAQLNDPVGVAVDSAGNLYIAEYYNFSIRKVSNGVIATVAGSGMSGFSGDNGPAISAQLVGPNAVAVDSVDNLYIADASLIRKVSNGLIFTVAGTGSPGFSGDNGPATNARLDSPQGLAVDAAGNVYVADTPNHRIRVLRATATQPSLTISKSHSGNFTQGQQIATYTVTVSNAGAGASAGLVTVSESLPDGLALVSMTGNGWDCSARTSCSRSDALSSAMSYPAITVAVNVASNATSPQLNVVSVIGGGSATASAQDSTLIVPAGTGGGPTRSLTA